MDPQTTLHDLLDAINRNDRELVAELLDALAQWNERGGFLPLIHRSPATGAYTVYRNHEEKESN
jgi:hypothetical protein